MCQSLCGNKFQFPLCKHRSVERWGQGQGFRKCPIVFQSGCIILHSHQHTPTTEQKGDGMLTVLAIYCEVCNVYTGRYAKSAQRPGKGQWKDIIIKLSRSVKHYYKRVCVMMQQQPTDKKEAWLKR